MITLAVCLMLLGIFVFGIGLSRLYSMIIQMMWLNTKVIFHKDKLETISYKFSTSVRLAAAFGIPIGLTLIGVGLVLLL